jgi:phosphoribosylformimino-5-aminoimidazole carboxamide ribonucleotide (ProFAR) isomerase
LQLRLYKINNVTHLDVIKVADACQSWNDAVFYCFEEKRQADVRTIADIIETDTSAQGFVEGVMIGTTEKHQRWAKNVAQPPTSCFCHMSTE